MSALTLSSSLFFFNDTATTEIYTLSLHDALPISTRFERSPRVVPFKVPGVPFRMPLSGWLGESKFCRLKRLRSEEHTSELQSQSNLVCRLLLEKKKN